MSNLIRARINPGWASVVSQDIGNIESFNSHHNQDISRKVDLRLLGGLIVLFSRHFCDMETAIELTKVTSVVNLAFENDGRLTTTEYMVEAAAEAERSALTAQLELRQQQSPEIDAAREIWVLPLRALRNLPSV